MSDFDDDFDDEEIDEDELDRVLNSGILEYYELQGIFHKASNRRSGCGWNGKEIVIGRDCAAEPLLYELAYCLVEVVKLSKKKRPFPLLHLVDRNDFLSAMDKKESTEFLIKEDNKQYPEDLLDVITRVSLLTLVFCRSLGFDTLQQMGELLQLEDPLRYPHDPNHPLDDGSPFLVYETRAQRKRIIKAFDWLHRGNFFYGPFTERSSTEIQFMLNKMFGLRNLNRWGFETKLSPVAFLDEGYFRSSAHPDVISGKKKFESKMSDTEYKGLRAAEFFIPKLEEDVNNMYFVYYTPIKRGKRSLVLDEPLTTEEGLDYFPTEKDAYEFLIDGIRSGAKGFSSPDVGDYVIIGEFGLDHMLSMMDDDDDDDDDDD